MTFSPTLETATEEAYNTFIENVRKFAPQLAELQPAWQQVPLPMKRAWLLAVEAALRASARGRA